MDEREKIALANVCEYLQELNGQNAHHVDAGILADVSVLESWAYTNNQQAHPRPLLSADEMAKVYTLTAEQSEYIATFLQKWAKAEAIGGTLGASIQANLTDNYHQWGIENYFTVNK